MLHEPCEDLPVSSEDVSIWWTNGETHVALLWILNQTLAGLEGSPKHPVHIVIPQKKQIFSTTYPFYTIHVVIPTCGHNWQSEFCSVWGFCFGAPRLHNLRKKGDRRPGKA